MIRHCRVPLYATSLSSSFQLLICQEILYSKGRKMVDTTRQEPTVLEMVNVRVLFTLLIQLCFFDNIPGPEEDVLKQSLQQYAAERLTNDQRIRRLKDQHELIIGYVTVFFSGIHVLMIALCSTTLLKKLNKYFNIPSARKPIPPEVATQKILNKMSEDPNRRQGTGTISTLLAIDGYNLPRSVFSLPLQVCC